MDEIKHFGNIYKNKKLFFIEKIKKEINPKKEITLELLFKKSKNGDSTEAFHNLCDNKGPTLTFIESSEGFIFGGYTPLDWSITDDWKSDDKTFLFSLSNNRIYKKLNVEKSIRCVRENGPWFAYLGVTNNSLSNGLYYSKKKTDFPFEDYSNIIPNEGKDRNFNVKEIEVFKIIFN